MTETNRAYAEIDVFVRHQLKIKAAQEQRSVKSLVTEAVLDKYPDIRMAKEANNASN